jgi:hypothetical protein
MIRTLASGDSDLCGMPVSFGQNCECSEASGKRGRRPLDVHALSLKATVERQAGWCVDAMHCIHIFLPIVVSFRVANFRGTDVHM